MEIFGTKIPPKHLAYMGWGSAVIGGLSVGGGISILIMTRLIMDYLPSWNLTMSNPQAFANVQLIGAVLIFVGFVFLAIGLYEVDYSHRTVTIPTQLSIPIDKKFCRYCGSENKVDAVYCEKCGKAR